jgi:hypothetical protein
MKYICPICNKQTKQLNLDREHHKWLCCDCFYDEDPKKFEKETKKDQNSLQVKNNLI